MQKHQQIPQISPFSYSDATEILWRWGRFRLIKKTRHHSGRSLSTSTSGFFSSLFYCSSFLPSYADLQNSGLGRNLRDSVFSLCQFPRPEGFSFLFYRGEDLGLVEGIQGWVQIPTGSLCQLCLCSVLSISPALCIISLDYWEAAVSLSDCSGCCECIIFCSWFPQTVQNPFIPFLNLRTSMAPTASMICSH